MLTTDLQVLFNAVRYAGNLKAGVVLDARKMTGEHMPLERLEFEGAVAYESAAGYVITAAGVEALKALES